MTARQWCHYLECYARADPLRPMRDEPDPGVPLCTSHQRQLTEALGSPATGSHAVVVERMRDSDGHPMVVIRRS